MAGPFVYRPMLPFGPWQAIVAAGQRELRFFSTGSLITKHNQLDESNHRGTHLTAFRRWLFLQLQL